MAADPRPPGGVQTMAQVATAAMGHVAVTESAFGWFEVRWTPVGSPGAFVCAVRWSGEWEGAPGLAAAHDDGASTSGALADVFEELLPALNGLAGDVEHAVVTLHSALVRARRRA